MNETMLLASDAAAPFAQDPKAGPAGESKGSPQQGVSVFGCSEKRASIEPRPTTVLGAPWEPDEPPATAISEMKTCPVCHARVFADIDTCYNCMYLFGSNVALEEKRHEDMEAAQAGAKALSSDQTDEVRSGASSGDAALFIEFLEELRGFLSQFLIERGVDIE